MNYPSNSVQSAESSPPPGQRKGTFGAAETLEAACAHVRGVYIERLDSVYEARVLPLMLRFRLAEWEAVEVFQAIQLALFPEEFAEDHEVAERYAEVKRGKMAGLIPRPTTGLLNHCGSDRLLASARALGMKLARAPVREKRESQGSLC